MSRGGGELPGWMRMLQEATPISAARLGFLLSGANPKVALLAVSGGLTIGAELAGLATEALSVLAFVLVACVTVAAPLIAYLLFGERVMPPLAHIRTWLERHNEALMALVLLVIGVALISTGLRHL